MLWHPSTPGYDAYGVRGTEIYTHTYMLVHGRIKEGSTWMDNLVIPSISSYAQIIISYIM